MSLESELGQLLASIRPEELDWLELPRLSRVRGANRVPKGLKLDEVEACLRAHKEVQELDGRILNLGNEQTKVGLGLISRLLIEQTLTKGWEYAVAGFAKFLQSDSVRKRVYLFVVGPNIAREMVLDSQLVVCPFSHLEPDVVSRYNSHLFSSDDNFSSPFGSFFPPSKVALQIDSFPRQARYIKPNLVAVLDQVFYPKWLGTENEIDEKTRRASAESAIAQDRKMNDLQRLLPLVDARVVRPQIQFDEYPDWLPTTKWSVQYYFLNQIVIPNEIIRKWSDKELEILHSVYETYSTASDELHRKVRIGVDRFNSALNETKLADKAIDLGISLESLLAGELDPLGTIGYQMKLRASLLLEESIEARSSVFHLVGEVYTCRSIAVHTGQLSERPTGKSLKRDTSQVISDGLTLVSRIIRRYLKDGVPDWRTFVLGGKAIR